MPSMTITAAAARQASYGGTFEELRKEVEAEIAKATARHETDALLFGSKFPGLYRAATDGAAQRADHPAVQLVAALKTAGYVLTAQPAYDQRDSDSVRVSWA